MLNAIYLHLRDLKGMIRRVVEGFQFFASLTELERILATDEIQRCRKEAEELLALIGVTARN
jgi:hypothetical protein